MPFKQFSNIKLPVSLRKPLLVDSNGLPRYWLIVWSSLFTYELKDSTIRVKLAYIENLYQFTDNLNGNGYLDDIISKIDIPEIGNLLEAFFINLRNQEKVTEATEKKWQTSYKFIKEITSHLNKNNFGRNKFSEVDSKLHHLGFLYDQLRIQKSKQPDILRSLPAEVVEYLFGMLDPSHNSKLNPFKRNLSRWNAYLSFICMLHMGLRRGEALLLPVNAVKSSYDAIKRRTRYWVNVQSLEDEDYLDTRHNKPEIKTLNSIRQIPISEITANLIQIYTDNYRGKPPHPFLFNSQKNTALSHESITNYYKKISEHIPKNILEVLKNRTGKTSVSPHDLRHTCAVIRLSQFLENGDTVELAMPKMRVFFGWSKDSNMPIKYAKAVFEDRMSSVWSNVFDDRVEILRNIPRGI